MLHRYRRICKATLIIGIGIGVTYHFSSTISTRFYSMWTDNTDRPEVACKIFLRHDQTSKDVGSHPNPNITIYAPSWMKEGLAILGQKLEGKKFQIFQKNHAISSFALSGSSLTLTELEKVARNEAMNVDGVINQRFYEEGGVTDTALILALKDLVRQSIIVGRDTATHYGGYPRGSRKKHLVPPVPVYISDLAALQFQQFYNSGRLVIINQDEIPGSTGLLDDLIFEKVVGERKKSYEEASQSKEEGRYIPIRAFSHQPSLLDAYAYRKFVQDDVVLVGLAFADAASNYGEKINFKFLKYGTGFFAGRLREQLSAHIFEGVVQGLEKLFENHQDRVDKVIGHIELPFYDERDISKKCIKRLKLLQEKYSVPYSFSMEDALKPTQPGLITATTNCGDTMVVIGNEMHFGSVDAAITENLQSKGSIFCPILNPEIKEQFIEIYDTHVDTSCDEVERNSLTSHKACSKDTKHHL